MKKTNTIAFYYTKLYHMYSRYKVKLVYIIVNKSHLLIVFGVIYNIILKNTVFCDENILQKVAGLCVDWDALDRFQETSDKVTEPELDHIKKDPVSESYPSTISESTPNDNKNITSSLESFSSSDTKSDSDSSSPDSAQASVTPSSTHSDAKFDNDNHSAGIEPSYPKFEEIYSNYHNCIKNIKVTDDIELTNKSLHFARTSIPLNLYAHNEQELRNPTSLMNRFQDSAVSESVSVNTYTYVAFRATLNTYNMLQLNNQENDPELFHHIFAVQFEAIYNSLIA